MRTLLLLACTALLAAGEAHGDRNVPLEIVFPPAAMAGNGGQVHDITKPPYGAKGDGTTDDTAAFVRMMNDVAAGVERHRAKQGGGPGWFWVPKGTYLVSDSLVHEREIKEGFCGLRLIGQDRRTTIIRLKDNSPGFQAGASKPVLTWSKDWQHHQCGIAWGNEVRNLTVDTGKGNPGAVGILFLGANGCSMDNLTIRSGDGQGHAGLWFPTWAVQGYFNDITVEGFDYGLQLLQSAEVNPAIEWLTLRGQQKAGIHVRHGCPGLRRVLSENAVPALRIDGSAAHVVLADSRLGKGAKDAAAIVVDAAEAQVFVRDVVTAGYGTAIDCAASLRKRGVAVPAPEGTRASASFATAGDGGADRLLDGNPDTFLAGAPNSCKAPREPVWVDLAFPQPLADLAGVELGAAERFGNYYAREVEVWADTDGKEGFDTPVARIAGLGGGGKQAALLDFGGRLPQVHGLRLLVVEQNRTGSNRGFHMNGVTLWADRAAAALAPTPAASSDRRIAELRAGQPPELATVGGRGTRTRVAAGTVAEWLNGEPVRLASPAKSSMRLPIEEVLPETWEKDPVQWATPEDFQGDDRTRIQAALSSGKANVMLTRERYAYSEELTVPRTVRRLSLMNANPRGPVLAINEASDVPLYIDHPGNRLVISIRAARPITIRYGDAAPDIVTSDPITLHYLALANTGPPPRFCPANARIFARSINNENKQKAQFPIDGGQLWVLSWKTEGPTEAFAVGNGGVLESLGGYRNNSMNDVGRPLLLNQGGQVSFIGFCNMINVFREAVWEESGGGTRKLGHLQLPPRSAAAGNYFVPLYLGYDPAAVAPLLKPVPPVRAQPARSAPR